MPDGQSLFKRKAALDLVPQLLPRLPTHHQTSRRLREVARHRQDLEHLAAWIDGLAADNKVNLDRAERVRNGLTHGGAAPPKSRPPFAALVRWHGHRCVRWLADSETGQADALVSSPPHRWLLQRRLNCGSSAGPGCSAPRSSRAPAYAFATCFERRHLP